MKRLAPGSSRAGISDTTIAILIDLPPWPGADPHEAARLLDFERGCFMSALTRPIVGQYLGALHRLAQRAHPDLGSRMPAAMFVGGCHAYIGDWHAFCVESGLDVPPLAPPGSRRGIGQHYEREAEDPETVLSGAVLEPGPDAG